MRTHNRILLAGAITLLGVVVAATSVASARDDPARPPNFVIVFTDDQGYQDVGCFGSPDIKTPNLDRMAREGMRFTNFYVSQAVCSASRAALMTGCYNVRVGILGALGPGARHGINADELTVAEVVKRRGYATAIYGKWHLGHHPKFLPTRHGFDDYFGLPYSNDMWPYHPTATHFPALPMIEGEKVINANVTAEDQTHLTTWYTERAVKFIEKNRQRPFLVYVPHSMPHVPLFVSEKFKGKSKRGLYGDVIMEIDWSVGQILNTLKKLDLDDNTLVIFTSDNGPWLSYGDHGGCALPLREGKGTMFDGGCREACIMRWPGKIPAGIVKDDLTTMMDILPTVAHLAGTQAPADRTIDGHDIRSILFDEPDGKSPYDDLGFFYYHMQQLQAVRSGPWKLYLPLEQKLRNLRGVLDGSESTDAELYDVRNDLGETQEVSAEHPEVVERLLALAEGAKNDLGDWDREGANQRVAGWVDDPKPQVLPS